MGYGLTYLKRIIVLWLIMGMAYFVIELIWRGYTNVTMIFIGGFCGVFIGFLNEFPNYFRLKVWQQCVAGTAGILIIEFSTGCIFNLWLHWNLWDYTGKWGNIMGQICLPYTLVWFMLCPIAIWLDDWLRFKLYHEGEFYNLSDIYMQLLKMR